MLITIGWLATLYSWRQRWLRQRQAWQWWHQHQAVQSHQTAESIRDGLLQQTFAFRRYLETAGQGDSGRAIASEQNTRWLDRLQTFYQSLESLSDELSPPFVADSLPLALQFTLKNWQSAQGDLFRDRPDLRLSIPSDQLQSSPHHNQIILSILTTLLTVLTPAGNSHTQLTVNLSHEADLNTLILKISNNTAPPLPKVSEIAELQHLKEIFHSLMTGKLDISQETTSITSRIQWQCDSTQAPRSNAFASLNHFLKP